MIREKTKIYFEKMYRRYIDVLVNNDKRNINDETSQSWYYYNNSAHYYMTYERNRE